MRAARSLLLVTGPAGCASVQPLGGHQAQALHHCNVKMYSSLEIARAGGAMEEMRMITGTSSGSFSPTVATAVQKHKDKAREYSADNVYVQAQDAGTLGTTSVTLIGFTCKKKQKGVRMTPPRIGPDTPVASATPRPQGGPQ